MSCRCPCPIVTLSSPSVSSPLQINDYYRVELRELLIEEVSFPPHDWPIEIMAEHLRRLTPVGDAEYQRDQIPGMALALRRNHRKMEVQTLFSPGRCARIAPCP